MISVDDSENGLLIDFGGTMAQINSTSPSWLSQTKFRYGPFVCESGSPEIFITHSDDETGMMAKHGCLSSVSHDKLSAEIAASEGTEVLDGVLRTILPSAIAPDLLVHGALLRDEERGFLCCGVSGAGKSTMASLFPEEALCDELVRLCVAQNGIEARSLPFWRARPDMVPLVAIYIIEHGVENRRTPLSFSKAIQELRRHIYWPVISSDMMAQSFGRLTDLCEQTPVLRLAFRPETSVWDTITGEL